MSRHVVFGTGQIGRLVAERLVSLGADVTAVNRTGSTPARLQLGPGFPAAAARSPRWWPWPSCCGALPGRFGSPFQGQFTVNLQP